MCYLRASVLFISFRFFTFLFFSFLFLLFRFFSHYFVFVFLRFVFFSFLFVTFLLVFFSFFFFPFLFVSFRFFPFLSLQVPVNCWFIMIMGLCKHFLARYVQSVCTDPLPWKTNNTQRVKFILYIYIIFMCLGCVL